jgi:DNA polymerase-3 subunit epsilon
MNMNSTPLPFATHLKACGNELPAILHHSTRRPLMRQIFLDTETTGLSADAGHRIVEIACIEVVNGKPTGREFHHYLDPQCEVPADAAAIHGLTSEFLKGKPLFIDIAAELIEFVAGAEVLIHNAPFDLAFLDRELCNSGIRTPFGHLCSKVTDTLPYFRGLFPGERCSLQALCDRFQIACAGGDRWHTALTDARKLAQLWTAISIPDRFGHCSQRSETCRGLYRRRSIRRKRHTHLSRLTHRPVGTI